MCSHLLLPRCHRPSPGNHGSASAYVPRITTSRRVVFRGCRYFVMFRPPSLLTPQIVPTAAILPQGSRGFYVRAYRALLPPHAPDMLTVRRQVIDGTGTCTLLDSQPCRLLQCLDHLFVFNELTLRRAIVSVRSSFRLPTILHPLATANSILVRRDNPLQMTLLPGGPSLALARYPPSLAILIR